MSEPTGGHWMWITPEQNEALAAGDPDMIRSVIEMAKCQQDWNYQHAKNEMNRAADAFALQSEQPPKKRVRA